MPVRANVNVSACENVGLYDATKSWYYAGGNGDVSAGGSLIIFLTEVSVFLLAEVFVFLLAKV